MARRKSSPSAERLRALLGGVWAFPAILLVLVLLLAAFGVSGSSVGEYHQLYYGPGSHDSNLLFGQPRSIRSDEWLVATTLTVAQSRQHFARINSSIGEGLDTSVIFDVPYREWSELFHPQNLPFFVLPLQNAFAMKWWLLDFALAVGAYFFALVFLPGRRVLAMLLALSLLLSPFVQWWYQTITVAPLAYSLILVSLFVASVRAQTRRAKLWLGVAMGYVLACFALVLYPPFQIPCAIVAAVVSAGFLLEQKVPKLSWSELGRKLLPAVFGLVLALAIVGLFWASHQKVIQAVEHSVYPGHRVVKAGGYGLLHLMDGFIDHQLQSDSAADHYQLNQSEASNFIYLWPFLLLPSLYLSLRRWQKEKTVEYAPLLTNLALLSFSAVLFLPLPAILLKLSSLSTVPHNRLLIGLGFANLASLVLFIRQLQLSKLPGRAALCFGLLSFAVLWGDGLILHRRHLQLLPHLGLFSLLAFTVAAAVYLLLKRRETAAVFLLVLLGFFSVFQVNPLYHGIGPIAGSPLEAAIRQTPGAQDGVWVDLDDLASVNTLAAAGVHTYSDTYSYPMLGLWRQQDPSGAFSDIYNRYGFAIFTTQKQNQAAPFTARTADSFFVRYDPCSASDFRGAITHVLSQHRVDSPCMALQRKVGFPYQSFYIYKPLPRR